MAMAGVSIPETAQHMQPPASCFTVIPSITSLSELTAVAAADASNSAPSMPSAPNSFTSTAHFSPVPNGATGAQALIDSQNMLPSFATRSLSTNGDMGIASCYEVE